MKLLAIVMIRGTAKAPHVVRDTLEMLGLKEPNNCVFLPDSPGFMGMLKLCKDHVTWGEVSQKVLEVSLKRWARVGSRRPTEDEWKKAGSWSGVSKHLAEGKTLRGLGFNKTLRLHPPRGGYKSVKRPFNAGGDLGNRGDKVNQLLEKMI